MLVFLLFLPRPSSGFFFFFFFFSLRPLQGYLALLATYKISGCVLTGGESRYK